MNISSRPWIQFWGVYTNHVLLTTHFILNFYQNERRLRALKMLPATRTLSGCGTRWLVDYPPSESGVSGPTSALAFFWMRRFISWEASVFSCEVRWLVWWSQGSLHWNHEKGINATHQLNFPEGRTWGPGGWQQPEGTALVLPPFSPDHLAVFQEQEQLIPGLWIA